MMRRVVERTRMTNYVLDRLECGHEHADHDGRSPVRRRCRQCAPPPEPLEYPGDELATRRTVD
jgi:hypothetical protein